MDITEVSRGETLVVLPFCFSTLQCCACSNFGFGGLRGGVTLIVAGIILVSRTPAHG